MLSANCAIEYTGQVGYKISKLGSRAGHVENAKEKEKLQTNFDFGLAAIAPC